MTDIEMLTRWADSIELFVAEALCPKRITTQQLGILQDIDQGVKDIAIKSGHGTGKTTLLAWVILWVGMFKYDAKIPATAPTAPQLIKLLIPEVRKWKDRLPPQLSNQITINNDAIKFTTGNECTPRTARKEAPEGLQGFHASYLTWIVDEASGVPNIIFEVIDGSLTGEDYLRIMAANPTRTEGFFFDAFHRNSQLWKVHTFNAEESENVSKESIERKKIQYGEDSDAYRVRVKGQFPRSNSDAVIPLHVIEDAIDREEFNTFGAEVWGVDYADAGDDKTKLVKRKGNHFYKVLECNVSGPHRQIETANWIANLYNMAEEKPMAVFVDAIGEGSGLVSALKQPHYKKIPTVAVKGSEQADDFETYGNKRAELYYKLKYVLEDEGKMFNDDMAIGELSAQRFFISERGKLMIVPKKEIKEVLGRSPDISDAMSLTCAKIVYDKSKHQTSLEPQQIDSWMGA